MLEDGRLIPSRTKNQDPISHFQIKVGPTILIPIPALILCANVVNDFDFGFQFPNLRSKTL